MTENKKIAIGIIAFVIVAIISPLLMASVSVYNNYHNVKSQPTYYLKPADYFNGYIVKSVVNDNQFYANLPNDSSDYLVTINIKDLKFSEILHEAPAEWLEITNIDAV